MALLNDSASSSNATGPASANNSTLTLEELNAEELPRFLPVLVFYVLLMILGIIGNTLVILIYKRYYKDAHARVNIISLALADLSVCVVGIPYHILDLVLLNTYTNTFLCRALSFLIGACSLSSVFILIVVGLDRWSAVYEPFYLRTGNGPIANFGNRRWSIIAVVVAVVVSIPNAVLYGESSVDTGREGLVGKECYIDDQYLSGGYLSVGVIYLGFELLLFFVTVITLIIIYGYICHKLYQRSESSEMRIDGNTRNGSHTARPESIELQEVGSDAMVRHGGKIGQETRKITIMMLTITIVFILSYLPYIMISILDVVIANFWLNCGISAEIGLNFLLRLYVINHVANPVIYCFHDPKFRGKCLIMMQKIIRCGRQPRDSSRCQNTSRSQQRQTIRT